MLQEKSASGTFFSEASPLPGHSIETISDVERALNEEAITEENISLPRSLRFAIEGLRAQKNPGKHIVRSNALLRWSGLAEARLQLKSFERAGYTHCKLKIPSQGWEDRLDLMEEFPGICFRLDANLGLGPRGLENILHALASRNLFTRVDYLEEPFAGVWEQRAFRNGPLSLAADESAPTAAIALGLLEAVNPPTVFVIKPTVAGGLYSLTPFLERITAANKRFVFTSALETEAGRRSILSFLSVQRSEVCGLATGFLFRDNFLSDSYAWSSIPAPEAQELAFLNSLGWKECR